VNTNHISGSAAHSLKGNDDTRTSIYLEGGGKLKNGKHRIDYFLHN
jgi:hypothetical protein